MVTVTREQMAAEFAISSGLPAVRAEKSSEPVYRLWCSTWVWVSFWVGPGHPFVTARDGFSRRSRPGGWCADDLIPALARVGSM